jgi:hypothetical protein
LTIRGIGPTYFERALVNIAFLERLRRGRRRCVVKDEIYLIMVVFLLVPTLCGGTQPDVLAGGSLVQPIGRQSFSQEVDKFGRFGRVVVEMAQVRPPEDSFMSVVIAVKALSGRELRTVKMDLLEMRGQIYLVRMFVDGRENYFEYSAKEDRVLYWWGPDKRTDHITKGVTACEGTGIWTCAVQAGLWGMVNPFAGALAGIACGVGFAVACN